MEFENASQLYRSLMSEHIDNLAPMVKMDDPTTHNIQSVNHVCTITTTDHDIQIVGIRSTIPLKRMDINTDTGHQLLSFPLDVMPYKDWNFVFPYPLSLLGKGEQYTVTFVPQNPEDQGIMEISLNLGNFNTDTILFPQIRFDQDAEIKKGITHVDISYVAHPCVGILIDVDDVHSIDAVRLSLNDTVTKKLRLFPLNPKTLYASLDDKPFPFHQGQEGIDFRKMPNLSRVGSIDLAVTSEKECKVRFRFVVANVLLWRKHIVGLRYI